MNELVITTGIQPPFTARPLKGGLEPIHIVASDGTTIVATVHRQQGYETVARQFSAAPELLAACKATLLFHSGGPWTSDKEYEWAELVHGRSPKDRGDRSKGLAISVTTKTLYDFIRAAIAKGES